MISQNPFDPQHHPTLFKWQKSFNQNLSANSEKVKKVQSSPLLYPKSSKIYKLTNQIALLE